MKIDNTLGDQIEEKIKQVLPNISEKVKKNCQCEKRKTWANNIGALFG